MYRNAGSCHFYSIFLALCISKSFLIKEINSNNNSSNDIDNADDDDDDNDNGNGNGNGNDNYNQRTDDI